jgi:hypothetical protein
MGLGRGCDGVASRSAISIAAQPMKHRRTISGSEIDQRAASCAFGGGSEGVDFLLSGQVSLRNFQEATF